MIGERDVSIVIRFVSFLSRHEVKSDLNSNFFIDAENIGFSLAAGHRVNAVKVIVAITDLQINSDLHRAIVNATEIYNTEVGVLYAHSTKYIRL